MLGMAHYARRVLECLFVHNYSNPTIPLADFLLSLLHYWVMFGVLVGYFLFHPKYVSPEWENCFFWMLVGSFLFTELMNCCCHLILMTLRIPGEHKAQIPWVFFTR